MQRHRHQEFIRFLNTVEAEVPLGKAIHAILDNYATHKHPKVRAWLARHPRWTFHFTPTSASWLNAVESFFAKLTRRRLKRGVFCSVVDLQAAINRFVEETNHDPKPFVWTADPNRVLAAVTRGKQALESVHVDIGSRFLLVQFLLTSSIGKPRCRRPISRWLTRAKPWLRCPTVHIRNCKVTWATHRTRTGPLVGCSKGLSFSIGLKLT